MIPTNSEPEHYMTTTAKQLKEQEAEDAIARQSAACWDELEYGIERVSPAIRERYRAARIIQETT